MFNSRAWLQKYSPFLSNAESETEMVSFEEPDELLEGNEDWLEEGDDQGWHSGSDDESPKDASEAGDLLDDRLEKQRQQQHLSPNRKYKNYSAVPRRAPRSCLPSLSGEWERPIAVQALTRFRHS